MILVPNKSRHPCAVPGCPGLADGSDFANGSDHYDCEAFDDDQDCDDINVPAGRAVGNRDQPTQKPDPRRRTHWTERVILNALHTAPSLCRSRLPEPDGAQVL